MHCGRSGAQFHCDDERALGRFAALFYGACGAQGRFHAERAAATRAARLPGSLAVVPERAAAPRVAGLGRFVARRSGSTLPRDYQSIMI